jgi:LPS-assembly protein
MNRLAFSLATILLSISCYAQEIEPSDFNLQLTPTTPDNIRITSENGADYNHETGLIRYLGGVQVYADNGIQLFADQALVDSQKSTIHLRGNVNIYQNSILHSGDKASYNYETEELDTSNLRTGLDPILVDSENFKIEMRDGERILIGKNARITTHDREQPNFWIKAKEMEVYPDEEITFKNLQLYAGDTPIFWLPYLKQPLNKELGYQFTPGVRSNWGPFLLNTYGIMLGGEENPNTGRKENQWLLSEWKFDIRGKRGIGTGLNLTDVRLDDNENLGWLKLYYANDQDPSITRNSLPRGTVNEDRYKAELKYRYDWQTSPDSENILDANITYLSDRYYLEDFEPSTYRTNPQPDNIIGYQHRRETLQWGAFTRYQLNDFYQADSRLPEIYLDQIRRPIFGTSFLHEGASSIGYYKEDLGTPEELAFRATRNDPLTSTAQRDSLDKLLDDKKFGRFHTYQEISRPIEVSNGISFTPRAGAGYTYYWDEGSSNSSHGSPHGYLGLDAAVKFSKNYASVRNRQLGIDQLLHIVQPYSTISVLSTNELDDDDTKIDRLTPAERPRPIDAARYNAIDDYRNWSIVRLGTRNKLLTKRDGSTHTWLTLDSYIDAFLNDPELDRNFSNLYNDLTWHPIPWTRLRLNTQFPISDQGFTELTTSLELLPTEDFEIRILHSYLDEHPTIEDNNLVSTSLFYRINHKWSIGTYHQWQLDDNVLEEQDYSIYRNFQSWTAGLGFFQRDSRLDTEYGALLSISLNALPSLNLPLAFDASGSN